MMLTLQIYVRPDISHLIEVGDDGVLRLQVCHLGVGQYGTHVQCHVGSGGQIPRLV